MSNIENQRGRIPVARDSWMWRWYEAWALRSGKGHATVDLCHFMRVLLILGPWRWFWQASYLRGLLRPWIVAFFVAAVSGITYAAVAYPDLTVRVLTIVGLIGLAFVIAVLIVTGVAYWHDVDPRRVEAIGFGIFYYGFIWLWWPLVKIKNGLLAPWNRWVLMPMFHTQIGPRRVGIWLWPFLVAGAYVVLLFLSWQETLAITAAIFSILAVLVGAIYGVVLLQEGIQERRALNKEEFAALSIEEQEKVLRETRRRKANRWRLTKLIWAWLVGMKHQICPLIEPTEHR